MLKQLFVAAVLAAVGTGCGTSQQHTRPSSQGHGGQLASNSKPSKPVILEQDVFATVQGRTFQQIITTTPGLPDRVEWKEVNFYKGPTSSAPPGVGVPLGATVQNGSSNGQVPPREMPREAPKPAELPKPKEGGRLSSQPYQETETSPTNVFPTVRTPVNIPSPNPPIPTTPMVSDLPATPVPTIGVPTFPTVPTGPTLPSIPVSEPKVPTVPMVPVFESKFPTVPSPVTVIPPPQAEQFKGPFLGEPVMVAPKAGEDREVPEVGEITVLQKKPNGTWGPGRRYSADGKFLNPEDFPEDNKQTEPRKLPKLTTSPAK